MNQLIVTYGAGFLQYIENEPGMIVGPIVAFLGYIIGFIFKFVSLLTQHNSLGISIILLTIVARTMMLPLGFKSQKSITGMQKLAPEVNKIKAKYGGSKDPEIQRKMNAEMQALYAKNKVNPLSGCLPLLITMPIFFALSYLMRQSYLFISPIGDTYSELARNLLAFEEGTFRAVMEPIARPYVPEKMIKEGFNFYMRELDGIPVGDLINGIPSNLLKIINRMSMTDWDAVKEAMRNAGMVQELANTETLLATKVSVETFFGINLIEYSGMQWPGVSIPILTAGTTFLSSYIANRLSPTMDKQAKSQQKVMMLIMPIMMIFFTVNMSAGVGLYWITSSVYQAVQQYFLHKYYSKDRKREAVS